MKTSIRIVILVLLFGWLGTADSFAQLTGRRDMVEVPRTSDTLQGNFAMIGNAISGLANGGRNPNTPYNGTANNNGQTFGYIDVDSDPSTFSSSSATLTSDSPGCARVVYAGLYWTATYYNRKQSNNDAVYTGLPTTDDRASRDGLPGTFRDVKFKPPGAADYIDIQVPDGVFDPTTELSGVLFDGWRNTITNPNNTAVKDVPYVCYADVTDLIPDPENAEGEYFVGNVRSTIGPSRNGVSAGWVLVVIYEDPTLPTRVFSSRFGFVQIQNSTGPEEFLYDNFRTLPAPLPVKARYGLSVLEGDRSITRDGLDIFPTPNATAPQAWTPLQSLPRNPADNFFNSTISIDGEHNLDRTPNSTNTLGLEIDVWNIQDAETGPAKNLYIGNDETSVRFRTTTSGDSYTVFVNTFAIEVIEPELTVTKRVLDNNGSDITGGDVNFDQELLYELTIQNFGNESLTDVSIRDVLPTNTDFTNGTIFVDDPSTVTATYDAATREILVEVDDSRVERFDGPITVRFGVRVVATCADLRDACSNEIGNIAFSRYTGVISNITRDGVESILALDACRFDVTGASNFLIRDDVCFTESQPAVLCRGEAVLTAGSGFPDYRWENVANPGVTIGTTQSITVTAPGTYRVYKTGSTDCRDGVETYTVTNENTVINPIIDIAQNLDSNPSASGNVRTCPTDGSLLPEIILCGASSFLDVNAGYSGAAITWERLDPAACSSIPRDENCPTVSPTCDPDWVEVATGQNYTLNDAGEYRITIDVSGDCPETVYFNVFRNNIDPQLNKINDILCPSNGGVNGAVEVQGVSTQYEFQLVNPDGTTTGWSGTRLYDNLTQPGTYVVNARLSSDPDGCIYPSNGVLIELIEPQITVTPTDPTCEGGFGSIDVAITDGQPNYRFILLDGSNNQIANIPTTTDADAGEFFNLAPDSYTVQIYTSNDVCMYDEPVTINDGDPFEVAVTLQRELSCNPGYQPDPTLNDPDDPNYDPTAPPFDADQYIALVQVEILSTPASGNYIFSSTSDFSSILTAESGATTTTYSFRFTTDGNYTIYVQDADSGCTDQGSVTVDPYIITEFTASPINPICATDPGSIEVNVTAGEGPFDFYLDGVLTAAATDALASAPGTFTFTNVDASVSHEVSVYDRFDCEVGPVTVNFTVPDAITATPTTIRELSCNATNPEAQVSIAISGGTGNYEYSFDATTGYTNVTSNPLILDFANDGSFTVYIRNQTTTTCVVEVPIVIDPLQEVDEVIVTPGDQDCSAQTTEVTLSANPALTTPAFYEFEVSPDPSTNTGGSSTGFSITTSYTFTNGVTYTVTARRSDTECEESVDFNQPEIDEIEITSANQTSPVTCNGGNDGAFSFTVDGIAPVNFNYEIIGPSPATTVVLTGSATASPVTIDDALVNLVDGTYTIVVSDPASSSDPTNACNATATVEITEPTVIDFDPRILNQNCVSSTNEVGVENVTGGNGPAYTYELFDSTDTSVNGGTSIPITQTYTGVPNDTGYYIIVTDTQGCTHREDFDINALPGLTVAITTSDLCLDEGIANFDVAITGGTADYSYRIERDGVQIVGATDIGASTTFTTPDFNQAGSYEVFVIDENGCVGSVTQVVEPAVTITATFVKDITCDAANTPSDAGEISLVIADGYPLYNIDLSSDNGTTFTNYLTGVNNPITNFTTTTPATYIFRVTDNEGCTHDSQPVQLRIPVAPTITANDVNLLCDGDTGTVEVIVNGTDPNYEIAFGPDGFTPDPIADYNTITGSSTFFPNLGEGVYDIFVRDSNGCVYTEEVEVITPDPIQEVSRIETPVTCGGSGTVTDLGAIDLTISGGTANYTYTLVTAANVSIRPLIPATTDASTPNPVTTGTSVQFRGLDFGQYFIFVEDVNGCVSTPDDPIGPFNIFSPPNDLVQNITISATCPGGVTFDIDVQGGSGVNPPANPPPGFDIRIVGEPTPGLGDFVPLNDDPLNATAVDANTPIRIHQYNSLEFNRTYILEVRDNATGCLYQELVDPVAPPSDPDIINAVVTDVTCNETPALDNGRIDFEIANYDPSVTEVEWEVFNFFTNVSLGAAYSGNATGLSGPNVPVSITGIPPGQYYVTVREVDGTQCPNRLDFEIELPDPLNSTIDGQTEANCNVNAFVVLNTTGGIQFGIPPTADGYTYELVANGAPEPATPFSLNSNTIDIGNTDGQVQDIWVADANGCTFGPITVTTVTIDDPVLTVPAFVDDACTYDNNYTFTVSGTGFGILTYQIDSASPVTGSIDNNNHEFTVTASGTYTITLRDANGCTDTETITVYDPLDIDAAFTTAPDCNNLTGVITATFTGTAAGTLSYELQDDTGTATGNTTGATTGVFTGVGPGNYIVVVTDDGRGPAPGCSFETPVGITAPVEPELITPAVNPSISCNGATDGTIEAVLRETPPPSSVDPAAVYTYEITAPIAVGPQSSPIFPNLGPGTYTVQVTATLSNGTLDVVCTDTADYTIDDVTVPVATVTQGDQFDCDGDPNATIEITALSGGNGADYTATITQPDGVIRTDLPVPTTATNIITAPIAGTYDVQIFDQNNCPSVVYQVDIDPYTPMFDPTVTIVQDITCPDDEVVRVEVSGGSGNYLFERIELDGSGNEVVVQTGVPATPPAPNANEFTLPRDLGIYTFRITDIGNVDGLGLNCTIRVTHEIDPFDNIETTAVQQTPESCFGDADGEALVTVTGYLGDLNYEVFNTDSGASVTTGTATITSDPGTFVIPGLSLGNYRVAILQTNAPECTDEAFFSIQGPANPLTVDAGPTDQATCVPGNDGAFQASITGARGNITYTIALQATPLVIIETNTDGNFDGLAPGQYVITATDDFNGENCNDTVNVEVLAPANDVAFDAIPDGSVTCFGDQDGRIEVLNTTGSNPPFFYSVTPLSTGIESARRDTGLFIDLAPDTYTVTVYDALGCTATQDVTINEPLEVLIAIDGPSDITCALPQTAQLDLIVTNGVAPFTYYVVEILDRDEFGNQVEDININPNGANNNTISNLDEGNYQFYVVDNNGCQSGRTPEVIIDAPDQLAIAPDLSNTFILCRGDETGSFDARITGGLGNNEYRLEGVDENTGLPIFRPGLDATVYGDTTFFNDLPAGTYTLYARSSPDCEETFDFQINQPAEELRAELTLRNISCNGETDGSIFVEPTGGSIATPDGTVRNYLYSLYNSAGEAVFIFLEDDIDETLGSHLFENLPADTYRIEVEDANGCVFQAIDILIEEPTPIIVDLVGNTTPETCAGDEDGTATVSITGGTVATDPADPSYFWSITGAETSFLPVADPTNLTITDLPGGLTVLFIRDVNGCQVEYNIEIDPGAILDAELVARIDCPVYDYSDPTNPVLIDGPRYFVDFELTQDSQQEDVEFMLTGINGTPDPSPSVSFTNTFEVVPGEYEGTLRDVSPDGAGCIEVIGTVIVEAYEPLSTPFAQMTNNPEDPNEYEIIVTGGSGNYRYFVAILPDGLLEQIEQSETTIDELPEELFRELDSNIFTVRETADYLIRVIDASFNCQADFIQNITYINIRIPNYFTPDGDGTDDRWYPRQISPNPDDPFFFDKIEVRVFDRYGRLLEEFQGDQGPDGGWDGIYKGELLPSGDYWYTIKLNDVDNREFTGHFTLYR